MKPNGQMERMVKMTKKDQGQRGMGGGGDPLLPPDGKPYMATVSDSVQCAKGWKRVIHGRYPNTVVTIRYPSTVVTIRYPNTVVSIRYPRRRACQW